LTAQAEPKRTWMIAALVASAFVAALLLRARFAQEAKLDETPPVEAPERKAPRALPLPTPPAMPDVIRWIAFGGGAEPVSNQVSIEQDLGLAQETLGHGGVLLFAGGGGRSPVQVLSSDQKFDALRERLGSLFYPRAGRSAIYRPTKLEPHGDATLGNVRRVLRKAFAQSGADPLLVFVAAHGDPGRNARENTVALWGAQPLTVAALAAIADGATRPLRFVVTSCFSGGFGEMVFRVADEEKGPATGDRCGLFAATWDTEASGCDPNPDRRAQESYGLHFLRALARRDRLDKKLPMKDIDLDGDRNVSLLEAHTRARIASRSFSIPTTTSDRWLRHAAPDAGASRAVELPEESAVISALGDHLRLPDAGAARQRLGALKARAKTADAELAKLERQLDTRWSVLRIALLERWPVLDDPYHPGYQATVEDQAKLISDFLASAQPAEHYDKAQAAARSARATLDDIELEASLVTRLLRAHETVALAGRLAAKGGDAWKQYERLLACERSLPPSDRE
jgi:hypothetical protein